MRQSAQHASVDPLHAYMAGGRIAGTDTPMPLVGTRFDVEIHGGLATVTTKRTFRNCETESIEATITFPVPVHAVLFALEARIDGRLLKARAQAKSQARATYEDALERGKGAVLHEELLRGIHMLSVGNIAPGAEIEVTAVWALVLTNTNRVGHLRIPLTVGDVYGCSGLLDSDELTHGGPVQVGQLSVTSSSGTVTYLGNRFDKEGIEIPLNAPIDLEVTDWFSADLHGRSADGRDVVVRIEPQKTVDAPLNIALAVDHSGSMAERCSSAHISETKHHAVLSGLDAIAANLGESDVVDLWEFDTGLTHLGSTKAQVGLLGRINPQPRQQLARMIAKLSHPQGGTEIGAALTKIAAQSPARDILLITDGKSHAIDVQALAQTGRRFSVVLIGEDSLEANVGHLAAITGGEIFVASNGNLASTLKAAFKSLRAPHTDIHDTAGVPNGLSTHRSGMTINVQWRPAGETAQDSLLAHGAAALAASLTLPLLDGEAATVLAEAEGLVTHLTSLVLVDEAAEQQSGIPATRKIALPTPMSSMLCDSSAQMLDSARSSIRFCRSSSPKSQVVEHLAMEMPSFLRRQFSVPSDVDYFLGDEDELTIGGKYADLQQENLLNELEQYFSKLDESLTRLAKETHKLNALRAETAQLIKYVREILDGVVSGLTHATDHDSAQRLEQCSHRISELNHRIVDNLSELARAEQLVTDLRIEVENILRRNLPELLTQVGRFIDWDHAPNKLQVGDLSELKNSLADHIEKLAAGAPFAHLADRLNVRPLALLIGLVAQSQKSNSRTAARIANATIGKRSLGDLT